MKNEKTLLIVSASLMCLFLAVGIFADIFLPDLFGNNIGILIYSIFSYITSTIGTIFFFYYGISKKVKLEDKRKSIIIISIFLFLFNIISGVLGFVVAYQLNDREKRDLPKLEILNSHKKIVYIILFTICMALLFGVRRVIDNDVLLFLLYIVIMLLTCSVFYKDLKRDIKYFKEYFREYSSFVFKNYLKGMGVLLIINLSIRVTTGITSPTNQVDINNELLIEPLKMIFVASIYAPICEEILFRGCFRKIINNKWLFIILSGFLFGAAHVVDDFQSLGELLYILSYASIGCFLAYVYHKTNNICTSIYYHFIQNTMSIIAILLLTLLK